MDLFHTFQHLKHTGIALLIAITFSLLSPVPGHAGVTLGGSGDGTVTSTPSGINCPTVCESDFGQGDVTLTATPDDGSALESWSGADCLGNPMDCKVTIDDPDYRITAFFYSDLDGDGVTDRVEKAGPNNGDGDGNGSPDFNEANVATLKNIKGDWVTMVSRVGSEIKRASCQGNPSENDAPPGRIFPRGFFGFTIQGLSQGETTTLKLIFHTVAACSIYYKYGPTPDNRADHWYEFAFDGQTGARIQNDYRQPIIYLYLEDGGQGDDDLIANGEITDIGAPAYSGTNAFSTGSGGGCFISTIMGEKARRE